MLSGIFRVCRMNKSQKKGGPERCASIRKQRRKKAAFARLRRQAPSTTTEGAVSNACGVGLGSFPCTRIKIGLFTVYAVLPQNFGWRKCKERPPKPWWLGGPLCVLYTPKFYGRTKLPEGKLRFLMLTHPKGPPYHLSMC